MSSQFQWDLLQLTRRLWVRATAFSVLAVATALVAILVKRYIPPDIPTKIGADAVDNLLNIIAASMLSVTIFSLSTLVAALASATNSVTPRATRLLSEDTTAQNALAIFVGTFLYSLVGIIALQTGLYGSTGRVVLYVVTLVVIAVMVATLLRWIHHVVKIGRVGTTTERVEEVTERAMRHRHKTPYLGGHPHTEVDALPEGCTPVHSGRMGYVEHIDMGALERACGSDAHRIYVEALPGAFVDTDRPLARVFGPCDDDMRAAVREAFAVADTRSFDQDPRFGVTVMAEIASRALSPAVNDAGTAIDVLGRAARVLSLWADPIPPDAVEVEYPRIHVPPVDISDLFNDIFIPIARDGAGTVEVGVRLQKTLRTLSRMGGPNYREAALRHSAMALERAEKALTLEDDLRRVREIASDLRSDRG